MKKLSTILLTVLACCTFVQQAFAVSYNLEAIRLYNMGLELYKKGAYKSAINSFKGAIEIQKDFQNHHVWQWQWICRQWKHGTIDQR